MMSCLPKRTLGSQWLLTALFALLLLGLAVPAASQQGQPPEILPERFQPDTVPSPPPSAGLLLESPEAAPAPAAPYIPWARIAYQEFHSNWEIMTAFDDNSALMRLTTNDVSDVEPDLNRGGSLVTYASDEGRDFEIMIVPAWGGTPINLTDNLVLDRHPRWSPDSGQIAFTSNRDGQLDIYVMNGDGSNVRRLTDSPADDMMPTWSPDGGQIAFSSNRSGGYRIYTMPVAGGEPVALTTHPYSLYPAWSPGGSVIAYSADSNNDGWLELWIYKLPTGTAQQLSYAQLRQDHLVSGWSPDANLVTYSQMVYQEYQGNYYLTRTESRAANSYLNDRSLVSSEGRSAAPSWATLDQQPPTGVIYPLPEVSPSEVEVRWGEGSDLGGAGLRDYVLLYQKGRNGPWQVWHASRYWGGTFENAEGGVTYTFQLLARDRAFNVPPVGPMTSTTIEWFPPQTTLSPLAARHRPDLGLLPISWEAVDPGGSGVANYDVQIQTDGGPWQFWTEQTELTEKSFSGTMGQTVAFRVRARDKAGNVEPWSEPEGPVAFYRWHLAGTVHDNSGAPLDGVNVTSSPAAQPGQTGSAGGTYDVHVGTDAGSYTVEWRKEGYLPLPPTRFDGRADAEFDVVLTPADNQVANWGFEESTLSAGWQVQAEGDLSVERINDTAHTGGYGAALGKFQTQFAPPLQLSNQRLAMGAFVDKAGTLHVVFSDRRADPGNVVVYRQRPAGGVWSPEEILGMVGPGDDILELALDGQDTLHLVWQDSAGIHYTNRPAGGSWATSILLTPEAGSSYVTLDTTAAGEVHIAWAEMGETTIEYRKRTRQGTWLPSQYLYHTDVHDLSIEAGVYGELYLFWQSACCLHFASYTANAWKYEGTLGSSSSYQVAVGEKRIIHVILDGSPRYYRQKPFREPWTAPVELQGIYEGVSSELMVGANGTLHLIDWTLVPYYVRRERDGSWRRIAPVTNERGSLPMGEAIDDAGTVHLFWYDANESTRLFYSQIADSIISPPVALEISNRKPEPEKVVVGPDGIPHLLWGNWSESDVYPQLMASEVTLRDSVGRAALTQQITLPPSLANPGLSFFYQLPGAEPLSLTVSDGLDSESWTVPAAAAWNHQWHSLEQWAGKSITLTFGFQQPAGTAQVRSLALLDEVSVSSTYPNLWLAGPPATHSPPGGQVVVHLAAGNLGEIAAPSSILTYTLPAGLSFVSAVPAPAESPGLLTWDLGTLAAGETQSIELVLAVAADTPALTSLESQLIIGGPAELETANNLATVAIEVSWKQWLPTVAR